MIVDNKSKVAFANYVTIPYSLAIFNADKTVAELSTEDIPIDTRVSKGKPIKRDDITEIKAVYAMKYKSDFSASQLRF
jgi:hypothetical protein